MDDDNLKRVKLIVYEISFLMEHQRILPDLKKMATELCPLNTESIDRNSPQYLLGAYEALIALISDLEGKKF
jgi:hypothetical protein